MAHSLSAKKRIRQNVKQRGRNRWRKEQAKEAVKALDEAVRKGDDQAAGERLKLVYKKVDKMAAKGAIHKKTAARKKSRLAKRMNKAK